MSAFDHPPTKARLDIAVQMAAALRDKFDFSDAEDYNKLAEKAFLAADALIAKAAALAIAAKAAELKKAKAEGRVVEMAFPVPSTEQPKSFTVTQEAAQ